MFGPGGAAIGAASCLLAAPYLAALTRTVPRRTLDRWWVAVRPGRRRLFETAVTGAVAGGLAGAAAGLSAWLPAFVLLGLVGTPLAVIDVEHHRLPDRLLAPGAVLAAVLLTLAAAVDDRWWALARAGIAAVVIGVVLLALALAVPGGFGLGDVKLGALLGGYLGWLGFAQAGYGILAGFVVGSIAGLTLIAVGRAGRKTPLAFGPALLLGALLVAAFSGG